MKTQTKGWVVMTDSHPNRKHKDAVIIWSSFKRTRSESIKSFLRSTNQTLRFFKKKYGYKCVRATQTIEIDQLPDIKKTI